MHNTCQLAHFWIGAVLAGALLIALPNAEVSAPRALIDDTIKPWGGVDGTLPQWVVFLEGEAWVSAEEVKDATGIFSETSSPKRASRRESPKTPERASNVARFI